MESILGNEKFKTLRKFLSEIPCIDHGGCNISAVVMYKFLETIGVKAEIIYGYFWINDPDFLTNLTKIKRGERITECADHVVLKVGDEVFDCSRDKWNMNEFKCYINVDINSAVSLINTAPWNRSFQKNIYIPLIEKKTQIQIC